MDGRCGCVGPPVLRLARCQTSKERLWWSQSSNYSNRKQCSTYKRRKIEWLALFFSKKAISNVGKKGKWKWRRTASKTLILHTRQHLGRATCPVNSQPAYISGIFIKGLFHWRIYNSIGSMYSYERGSVSTVVCHLFVVQVPERSAVCSQALCVVSGEANFERPSRSYFFLESRQQAIVV